MTDALSVVVVALMKGIADRESDPVLWQSLIGIQARVRDFVACLGLDLVLDEAEGFAYLRQRPAEAGVPQLPRLVPRPQLGYQGSLTLGPFRNEVGGFAATNRRDRL